MCFVWILAQTRFRGVRLKPRIDRAAWWRAVPGTQWPEGWTTS
jgi:hypothetical protein